MNQIDFYDKVGKVNGWNFSEFKCESEGVKWNFYEEVQARCNHSDILLDIGTGGGENALKIASSLCLLIGIDLSRGMVETAKSNLNHSGLSNVRFLQMSSENLQFPAEFFDLVSNQHAPFNPKEVANVLKKGGTFLTQQVSEGDKLNVKKHSVEGSHLQKKMGH